MIHLETERKLKGDFAAALIREKLPFKAALIVCPGDVGAALRMSVEWLVDDEVLAIKASLLADTDELLFLPTKADLSREIWERMDSPNLCHDDFTKMAKLYAEVRGFIDKAKEGSGGFAKLIPSVMRVTDHGSDDEWKEKIKSQQKKLSNV